MILALDIGNTFTKTGIFDKDILVFSEKTKTDSFTADNIKKYNITGCAISSVVPTAAERLINMINTNFGITPYVITYKSKLSLEINYKTPESLGIDRLCGAEGAYWLFSKKGLVFNKNEAIISIDFGTASTINIIRYPNLFTGGIIAPGIKMMFESLNRNTSQLPEAEFREYDSVIGNSTNSSIASGVINSTIGMIDRTRKYLSEKFGAEYIHFFITGGNAESIIPHLDFKFKYEPALVLIGVYSIYDRNKQ